MTHASWVRYKNVLRGCVRVRRIVRKTGDRKGNGGRKKKSTSRPSLSVGNFIKSSQGLLNVKPRFHAWDAIGTHVIAGITQQQKFIRLRHVWFLRYAPLLFGSAPFHCAVELRGCILGFRRSFCSVLRITQVKKSSNWIRSRRSCQRFQTQREVVGDSARETARTRLNPAQNDR